MKFNFFSPSRISLTTRVIITKLRAANSNYAVVDRTMLNAICTRVGHFPRGRDLIEDGPPSANNQQQLLFDGYSNIYPVADYNMWALSPRIVEGKKRTKQRAKEASRRYLLGGFIAAAVDFCFCLAGGCRIDAIRVI